MAQDLIDRLNTYRLEHKITQTKLARKLGVTFQTVNRWLNRRMQPSEMQEYHIKKLVAGSNGKKQSSP